MSTCKIFRNLTKPEHDSAKDWIKRLREPEQGRVLRTLEILTTAEFRMYCPFGKVAVIAAGSSLDTNTYTDIDLFVLAQKGINPYEDRATNPRTGFAIVLADQLPEHAIVGQYSPERRRSQREHANPRDLIASGNGALVAVSLFYEMRGFEEMRPGKLDDLIQPNSNLMMGAEALMQYNRENGAKFMVLSRNYNP